MLRATGLTTLAAGFLQAARLAGQTANAEQSPAHLTHAMGTVGRVQSNEFNPSSFLRSWNFSDLPAGQREEFYRETPRPDGTLLREYEIFSIDREIEIAPGIFFPAWTFNGQVPGPTIRATEGDRIRITFRNLGMHPHTMHFHGWHPPAMDGSRPGQEVQPGETFVYEFDADPFGLHLYHCHTVPLKRHIHKGLYGAFIVDPRESRPPADELVLVMNGFDTNFDVENEVYAVNTVANAYMDEPVRVSVGGLVRIYLVNVTEFRSHQQPAPARHVFRRVSHWYLLTPGEKTDTLMLCQGERAILETTFRYEGDFMFHAHQSEFAELGWMGLFRAETREDV